MNKEVAVYQNKEVEKNVIEEISVLHNDIKSLMQETFQKALRLGELLTDVKARLPHGSFIGWIENNCPFSRYTAHRYMIIYEKRGELETQCITNLSQAYKWLGKCSTVTHLTDGSVDAEAQIIEIDETKELNECYAKIEELSDKLEALSLEIDKKDNKIAIMENKLDKSLAGKKAQDELFDAIRKTRDVVLKPDNLEGDWNELILFQKIISKSKKTFRESLIQLQTLQLTKQSLTNKVLKTHVEEFLQLINKWGLTVAKKFHIDMENIK